MLMAVYSPVCVLPISGATVLPSASAPPDTSLCSQQRWIAYCCPALLFQSVFLPNVKHCQIIQPKSCEMGRWPPLHLPLFLSYLRQILATDCPVTSALWPIHLITGLCPLPSFQCLFSWLLKIPVPIAYSIPAHPIQSNSSLKKI